MGEEELTIAEEWHGFQYIVVCVQGLWLKNPPRRVSSRVSADLRVYELSGSHGLSQNLSKKGCVNGHCVDDGGQQANYSRDLVQGFKGSLSNGLIPNTDLARFRLCLQYGAPCEP